MTSRRMTNISSHHVAFTPIILNMKAYFLEQFRCKTLQRNSTVLSVNKQAGQLTGRPAGNTDIHSMIRMYDLEQPK